MNVLGKIIFFDYIYQNSLVLFVFFNSYLNKWDKKIPNIDVADDYRSEREEIHKAQGKNFPFSFGDVSKTKNYFVIKNNLFFL